MQNLFRKRKKNNIFKIVTIAFSFLLLILTLNYYVNYKYSKITSEFYSEFNNCNFTDAKSLIDSDNIYLKLRERLRLVRWICSSKSRSFHLSLRV